ncbi:MAG: hypothetical protein FWF56_06500 [Firmicutes bacterium]|nr:hypothetical protein [Bacillota bacterium]MCL1953728.1 hypothetical protein [Bacillota bacterium]
MVKKFSKKYTKAVLAFMLALFTLFIVACSPSSINISGEPQNLQHIVTSNGGIAVQYGNYVYFVNGYRGYDDSDGNQNNDVIKGGILRAELFGNGKIGADFEILSNFEYELSKDSTLDKQKWEREHKDQVDLYFTNQRIKDPNNPLEDITEVLTQRIGDKTVGTAEYKKGGLWIFEDNIYFASPSNKRDSSGTLQIDYTIFYRINLLTGVKTEIYATHSPAKDKPYAFYYYNSNVYLVTQDNQDLVSVQASGNVGKPLVVASNITGVVMQTASIYYSGMPQDYTENFVYYTRSHPKDESYKQGNLLEMIRPDGSQATVIESSLTTSVHSVRDGLLFYTKSDPLNEDGKVLAYDNLFNIRKELAINNGVSEDSFLNNNLYNIDGTLNDDIANNLYRQVYINERGLAKGSVFSFKDEDYTSIYAFRSNRNSNNALALTTTENDMRYWDSSKPRTSVQILNSASTIQMVQDDGFVYYLDSDNKIFRTLYNKDIKDNRTEQLSTQGVSTEGLQIDMAAGQLFFFARVDEWANNYTFVRGVSLNPEAKEHFVGQRIEDDLKPDPSEETGGGDGEDGGDEGESGGEDGGSENETRVTNK